MKPSVLTSEFSVVALLASSFTVFTPSTVDLLGSDSTPQNEVTYVEPTAPTDDEYLFAEDSALEVDQSSQARSDSLVPTGGTAASVEDPMAQNVIPATPGTNQFNKNRYWWPAECETIVTSMNTSSTHAEALALINQTRARYGIPLLYADQNLINSATTWSNTMASSGYRHSNVQQVLDFGWQRGAENIRQWGTTSSTKQDSSAAAVCGWLGSSSGHRDALLSAGYEAIGIAGTYSQEVRDGKTWNFWYYTSHLGGSPRSSSVPRPVGGSNPTPTPTPTTNPTATPTPTPTPTAPSTFTGWKLDGGKWYYYINDQKHTGWLALNGSWYYLQPATGEMSTGWTVVGATWYYMNASGVMQTGWTAINGSWYYLQPPSGDMIKGWLGLGGLWYFLSGSGAMATGWTQVGNSWYYMNASGVMQTGWIALGGYWYYLTPGGAMATGTYFVDGRYQSFASNGVWLG